MIIAHISPRTGGKTTSVGWHAHALHQRGHAVTAFEADYSHQLTEWDACAGGFPFPVQQQASPMFYKNVPPTMAPGQIGVVDCGHAEDHRTIVQSVLRVTDVAILNTAPTTADIDRIDRLPMRDLIEDIAVLRPDGNPPPTWVLLNRTVTGAKATNDYRAYLTDHGWNIFTTTIPNRQLYAQSMLHPVTAKGSAYDELVTEMTDRGLLPTIGDQR
ncbi:ParA family protein [Streptacidiphilus sp. PAMC 29251]